MDRECADGVATLLEIARGAETAQRGLLVRSGVLIEFQIFWEVPQLK